MSNPEKSAQQGEFPPPPPGPPPGQGLLSSQDYPPPPPGPPPASSQYQEQSSGLLPSYDQVPPPAGGPPPEKQQQEFPPPPPGPPPQQGEHSGLPSYQSHHHDFAQGAPTSASEKEQLKQQFPPPPPGPPPAHDAHPNPLNANPVGQAPLNTQNQRFDGPSDQSYTVPQYNPADPVFAPPPTNQVNPEQTTATGTTATPASTPVEAHKKVGWAERFSQLGLKAAAPINSLAHKLGSQSFLPETMDKECDKAVAILTAFCKKGTYADPKSDQVPTSTDPKATETTDGIIDPTKEKPKSRVIVTIPPKVISKAVGLAIFTTLRAGFQVSGAIGSGILIARLPDGSWGPPSGIQVNTLGGGFLVGLDIYDCVCVINSKEALAAFTNTRVSLGSDLAVVAGPYGAGGVLEFGTAMEDKGDAKNKDKKDKKDKKKDKEEVPVAPTSPTAPTGPADQSLKPEKDDKKAKRRSLSASAFKPVFSYVKSRGFYAGIQIDGTVIVERKDANAAFYGEKVPVAKILGGHVPAQGPPDMWPAGARSLLETLKEIDARAFKGKAPEQIPAGGPRSDPAPGFRETDQPPAFSSEQQPPAYVDDGVPKPGVGDHKVQYQ